jgi:hypothetical protein
MLNRGTVVGVSFGVIAATIAIIFLVSENAGAESDLASDLSMVSGVAPSQAVQNFAAAIAFAEGFWDINENELTGNLPNINNNPGDIESGGSLNTYATTDEGWAALYAQLTLIATGGSRVYDYSTDTIGSMAAKWTATDPDGWASNVCAFLQNNFGATDASGNPVSPATPIDEVLS